MSDISVTIDRQTGDKNCLWCEALFSSVNHQTYCSSDCRREMTQSRMNGNYSAPSALETTPKLYTRRLKETGLFYRDYINENDKAAAKYGITPETMPTPAGGCLLADEQISRKVGLTFERFRPGVPSRADILLDILGRKFMLDENTVLIVSRNEEENRMLSSMVFQGNTFLKIADVPGPMCVMRGDASEKNLRTAAAVCLRYSKGRGMEGRVAVYGPDPSALTGTVEASAVSEEYCRRFQIDLNK